MQGRTRLIPLLLVVACWLPATAAAAPMPAGTYDVTLQDGTLNVGDGLLPPIPMQTSSSFVVPISSQPVAAPIGLTLLSSPINQSTSNYTFTGTLDVTVLGAGATLDPATGEATIDASFYATLTGSGTVTLSGVTFPASGSCSFGSSSQPINLHLSSLQGTEWDPATGAMTLVDHTFAFPYSCPGLIGSLISFLVGTTDAGKNVATVAGTLIRRPDPVTPPTTTTTSTGAGTTPSGTSGNPAETTPLSAPTATKSCIVPKLVGKTLKQAKRVLTKAGCKVGKAKKANSKKRKKGRIVKQRYKAGTKLPAGTKVPLTLSKGPKQARKHRSR